MLFRIFMISPVRVDSVVRLKSFADLSLNCGEKDENISSKRRHTGGASWMRFNSPSLSLGSVAAAVRVPLGIPARYKSPMSAENKVN